MLQNQSEGDRKRNVVYFIMDDKDTYLKFKEKVKSKGLTVSGVLSSIIKKIADEKLDVFELIKP